MDRDLRARYAFFRHQGGWVGHDAELSLRLARAERYAERTGWCSRWEPDEDFDLSDLEPGIASEVSEVWCVSTYSPEHCDGSSHDRRPRDRAYPADSICGVIDPDRTYRRVVEAEMYNNAMAEAGVDREEMGMTDEQELERLARLVGTHGGVTPTDAVNRASMRLDGAARSLREASRFMRMEDCVSAARGLSAALVGIGMADAMVSAVREDGDAQAVMDTAERMRRRVGRFQTLFSRRCVRSVPSPSFRRRSERSRGGLLEF